MHDLLVIGGGPGGVAAAAYAIHLGLDTLVVSPDLGGKVNYRFALRGLPSVETVHGAPLVRTFAAAIGPAAHVAQSAQAIEPVAGGFRVTLADGSAREGRALVLAMGARPRQLFVPGAAELWGSGLSYSAWSHAPLVVGRAVAVIGNDRRAQVAALEVARVAHEVYFVTPQPQTLDAALLERLRERGNTHLVRRWEVTAVNGSDFVSGLTLQSGDGVVRELKLDAVFVELGLIPNSDLVADLVARDERGHIPVDHRAATSHPAIFAAGDVTNVHGEQVPVALGEGIKAALSASDFLAGLSAGA